VILGCTSRAGVQNGRPAGSGLNDVNPLAAAVLKRVYLDLADRVEDVLVLLTQAAEREPHNRRTHLTRHCMESNGTEPVAGDPGCGGSVKGRMK